MALRSTAHRCRPLGWMLALAALALWSCGTPEERYKWLSLVFDGVPLPPSMQSTIEGDEDNRIALVVTQHAPYAADKCSDCHGEVGKFSMSLEGYSGVTAQVCLKCHAGTREEHPWMHGPVASVECLACHEPHESRYAHLLRERAPKLCLQCHAAVDLKAGGIPEHEDLGRDCLNCHIGHGGRDMYFLRIDLSPPKPPEPSKPLEPTGPAEDAGGGAGSGGGP